MRSSRLTKLGGDNDGDDGAQLHGEATRGRVKGEAVTQVAHDVVAVGPDTNSDGSTTERARERASVSTWAPY